MSDRTSYIYIYTYGKIYIVCAYVKMVPAVIFMEYLLKITSLHVLLCLMIYII